VFLAPPWGGLKYCNENYNLFDMVYPDISQILKKAMEISNNVVFLLGRNTKVDELVQLFSEYFHEFDM